MTALFHSIIDRLKALFVTTVALDFEALVAAGQAERKANLLRQAEQYESEGLVSVAQDLRVQAENLSLHRPLACTLPAIAHLQPGCESSLSKAGASEAVPATQKKAGRR